MFDLATIKLVAECIKQNCAMSGSNLLPKLVQKPALKLGVVRSSCSFKTFDMSVSKLIKLLVLQAR